MKRAICLGTNYEGTPNELSWCVKDAIDLSGVFFSHGFSVTTLTENNVGRNVFLSALCELVDQAISGQITGFVLTSSGHGSQSFNADEPDYYDEVLYFLDGYVYDNEVRAILDRLPEGFPNFLFFDHCFSGGMMRKSSKDKIRFVPSDVSIPATAKPRRFLRAEQGNEVYMSACGEGEYSYDAGNLKNGAGTYYLKNAIQSNTTFQDWIGYVRTYLPSQEYPQTPNLECKNDLKYMIFPAWFNNVSTGMDDIEGDPIPPPPVKLTLWQRFIRWIKNLFS